MAQLLKPTTFAAKQYNGLTEVVVWQDGGQSAASVRREEWGEESRRGHKELGQAKKLTALVCGGKVFHAPLLPPEVPPLMLAYVLLLTQADGPTNLARRHAHVRLYRCPSLLSNICTHCSCPACFAPCVLSMRLVHLMIHPLTRHGLIYSPRLSVSVTCDQRRTRMSTPSKGSFGVGGMSMERAMSIS